MGLMLSVVVLCVGVVEVWDCWRHFLLNLVQPQYNPLPFHLDPNKEILSESGLISSIDSRRPSRADICWPKDLSPTDDLHVIKKRSHSESERKHDQERELLGHNQTRSVISPDKNSDQKKDPGGNLSAPKIEIHCFDDDRNEITEVKSRENSPNLLELDVIVESESSSEVDEPSEIENLAYIPKSKEASQTNDTIIVKLEQQNDVTGQTDAHRARLTYPAEEVSDEASANETSEILIKQSFLPSEQTEEAHASSTTPGSVPRDDIKKAASNVSGTSNRVLCSTAVQTEDISIEDISRPLKSRDNHAKAETYGTSIPQESMISERVSDLVSTSVDNSQENQSVSSPITLNNSTDSSINTSDASSIAQNSRTSDRPLVIPFASAEDLANEFLSVTEINLQAFSTGQSPTKDDKSDADLPEDQPQRGQISTRKSTHSRERPLQTTRNEQVLTETNESSDKIKNGTFCEELRESTQAETNSSSSSLSGIPQLPEDARENILTTNLPSDNGFAKTSLETQDGYPKTADSVSDYLIHESNESQDLEVSCEPERQKSTDGPESSDKNNVLQEQEACASLENTKNTGNIQSEALQSINNNVSSSINCPISLSPVDGTESQPLQSREHLEEMEHSKETELPEEDFKPVPLQRRDTKRKSKFTPRTFSKENLSRSEDKEMCDLSEISEMEKQAENVPVRTASPHTGGEDSDQPSNLDKHEDSNSPSTEACPSAPSKIEQQLIFSGEYTKAMNKDWHSGHFCCWQCDESLTGQRYVLRDEHPYCIKCYESVFANSCEECNKTIGIDSKDLSYKDKHWHEACFLCNKCRVSLVDKQFGSKLDKIFCANCYDAQFASRCDGCGQIFKAGTKKMEYKTRQWHEPCFACCVCKSAIGTKSFIPREQEIYCATCYEEKFATRCVKCNKIITSGGVTYKNEPWHRECFTCTNCSASLAGQRFTSRDEKPYCAECFGELFAKRCTACCKPITGIGGTRFISFEDRHWHNDCFICASCKTSLVGRGFITDAEDIICPECAKQKLM